MKIVPPFCKEWAITYFYAGKSDRVMTKMISREIKFKYHEKNL